LKTVILLLLCLVLFTVPVRANAPIEPQPPEPCAKQGASSPIPQPLEPAVYLPLLVN
jgi:hypothetical protein